MPLARALSRVVVVAALGAVACLTGCSDYDRARNAYEGGDYAQALQRFEVLAKAGNARAQYDLAQMYFQGIGTAKDVQQGWHWLLSAAGSGNVAAMVQLGAVYESGVGAPRDYATAAQWYLRAARKGDAVGRFNLALMYLKGIGVPRDEVAALAWFRLSFKAGGAAARDRANEIERSLAADEVQRAKALADSLERDAAN